MAKVRIPFVIANQVYSFWMDDHNDRDFILQLIVRHGLTTYEDPLPRLIAGIALQVGGNFLDIGANTGVYSLLYSCVAPRARVYAFEPLPIVAEALESNVSLNPHLAERIHIDRSALSDRDGACNWYETINDQGFFSTSSTLRETHAKAVGQYKSRTVTTRSLDGFHFDFCFAKIDVEGVEAAVLAGGQQAIAKNRPILAIEVLRNADYRSLNRWISTTGYVVFAACPGLLLRLDNIEFVAGSQNHILCPHEGVQRLVGAAKVADLTIG